MMATTILYCLLFSVAQGSKTGDQKTGKCVKICLESWESNGDRCYLWQNNQTIWIKAEEFCGKVLAECSHAELVSCSHITITKEWFQMKLSGEKQSGSAPTVKWFQLFGSAFGQNHSCVCLCV